MSASDATIDDALAALLALATTRMGQRAARQMVGSLATLKSSGTPELYVRQAVEQTRASLSAMPSPASPFSLPIAHAIACVGCPNLDAYADRVVRADAIGVPAVEVAGVATHADALVPSFGEEDALFCAQIAWQNHHHFRQRLIVGRAHNRNDAAPSARLFAAWQRQGGHDVPVGVVDADVGTAGVVVALGAAPSADVHVPFVAEAFLFRADDGSDVDLSSLRGLQSFLARVPLPVAPHTLAWLVHLVRMAVGGGRVFVSAVDDDDRNNDDDDLVAAWRNREEDALTAPVASALLGRGPPRAAWPTQIALRVGDVRLRYAQGELSIL